MVAHPHPPPPKLILLLMTDQFRQDAFQPWITPNLHKLSQAWNATTFTNAYVSTPTCTPSRAALLTGKSPWNHGMLGYANTVNCQEYPTTLPTMLTELEHYETFAVGKNHFGWDDPHNNGKNYVTHGFQHLQVYDALTAEPYPDEYRQYFDQLHPGLNPINMTVCNNNDNANARLEYNDWKSCAYGNDKEEEHPTPWTTRQALEYLKEFDFGTLDDKDGILSNKTRHKNMFLKVSYHRPHSPYDPPRRLLEKHLHHSNSIPKRILNNTSWDAKFQNKTEMSHDAWNGDPGEAAARHSRAGYLASVEFVDEGVGKILDWLEKHNLFDDAMILWTTDHGDMNGDHNLWRKGYAYEGSSHVNLVAKLPSTLTKTKQAPSVSSALVETRDIAVTFYDALGILDQVQLRDPMVNGKSLMPLLLQDVAPPESFRPWLDLEHGPLYRQDIFWNAIVGFHSPTISNNNDSSSLRSSSSSSSVLLWKYIFHAFDGDEQLFCLSSDPKESFDLSSEEQWQPMLHYWRQVMVNQFLTENRGSNWVQNGTLVVGRKGIKFGPNFPCEAAAGVTDA